MKNLIFIGLFLLCFNVLQSQEMINKDTLNGTELTISMDQRVNNGLEDMEERCSRIANSSNSSGSSSGKPKVLVPNRELTTAEICRQNPRILGYKIQVNIVNSNAESNQIKASFRSKFPYIKVMTDASLRPNYKILAGSYFTKQSAAADYNKIKQSFNSARIVQYQIFCAEAK